MKMPLCIAPIALLLLLSSSNHRLFACFYDESRIGGFYFFEDPRQERSPSEKAPPTPQEAAELIEEQKVELHQLRCLALLLPSKDNLINYMEMQNKSVEMAATFAERWGAVLLNFPHLGGGATSSTSSIGIEVHKRVEEQQKLSTLEKLKEHLFLLLFTKEEDPYSEEAAKVLLQFRVITGWEVRAISLKGPPPKSIPHSLANRGIAERYGIREAPAFLMVNPDTKEGYPVGVGVLSVTELIDNMVKQVKIHHIEASP